MNLRRTFISYLAVAVSLAIWAIPTNAQSAVRNVTTQPFEPAEELIYEGEFSRSLLRKLDVADFKFTANRTQQNTQPKTSSVENAQSPQVLVLTGDISSKGFFARLFNIKFRERMESVVDPATFSVQNSKRLDEQGRRARQSEAVFDSTGGTVVWTEHDPRNPSSPTKRVTAEYAPPVHDVLSAIYYLRTQPLKVGTNFDLKVSDSGVVYTVPIRVVEKKRMKSILGRTDSVKVEVGLFGPSGMVDHEGQFSIWFTDDARRIPVSARVKTEYGTFDIKLKKVVRTSSTQQYLTKKP